jgi:hypothetical protein
MLRYWLTIDTVAPMLSLKVWPIPVPGLLVGEVYQEEARVLSVASDITTWVTIQEYEVTDALGGTENVDESYLFKPNVNELNPWELTQKFLLFPYEETTILVTVTDRAGNKASDTAVLTYIIPDVTKVIGKAGGTVESPDGSKIEIPAGALQRDTLIDIHLPFEEELPSVEEDCRYRTRFARIFSPEELVYLKWVEITVPYYDFEIERLANDVFDLDPVEFEENLTLFYWDGMKWHRVDSEVDTVANVLTARVNHNGLFCVMADYCEATEGFQVYLTANPFSPNADGRKDQTIFKYKLPEDGDVSLHVYDMTGDLVRTLAEDEPEEAGCWHELAWTGENDFATYVGSGIYLFKFEFTGPTTHKVVVKPVGVIR